MKRVFFQKLLDLVQKDENLFFITADVGYNFAEPLVENYPDRCINVGVAEQNMIGISAGLALCKRKVFCYSVSTFASLRCAEQIRNDVCFHNLNIKIAASFGGLGYGPQAFTHHVLEDIAVMRALPNMIVIVPGDKNEIEFAVGAAYATDGPFYIRLERGSDVVHDSSVKFRIGEAVVALEGNNVTLISTGGLLSNVVEAAGMLDESHISARVLSMHTLKPIDVDSILSAAKETKAIFSIEEHGPVGGLYSAIAEVLDASRERVPLVRICVERPFFREVGSHEYLQNVHGLTADAIFKKVKESGLVH